ELKIAITFIKTCKWSYAKNVKFVSAKDRGCAGIFLVSVTNTRAHCEIVTDKKAHRRQDAQRMAFRVCVLYFRVVVRHVSAQNGLPFFGLCISCECHCCGCC